jgi:glycine/D-amino acid oxidase-like deaminating enzyme
MTDCDVIVVGMPTSCRSLDHMLLGAGVVGSSTALALAKRGLKVILLEQVSTSSDALISRPVRGPTQEWQLPWWFSHHQTSLSAEALRRDDEIGMSLLLRWTLKEQAFPLWESIMKESGTSFFKLVDESSNESNRRPTGGLNVGVNGKKIKDIIDNARSVGAPIEVINAKQIQERYGLLFSLWLAEYDRTHLRRRLRWSCGSRCWCS